VNQFKKIDMMEATRLTREGRLEDAVRLLLGAAAGSSEFRASAAQGSGVKHFLDFQNDETWQRNTQASDFLVGQIRQFGSPRALRGLAEPLARKQVPIPDGARFEGRVYLDSAGSRAYKLYIPSGYVGQAVPLVVMLHGCKQSPDDFALGTRMNELAEEQCFLVVYPAQSASANASRCWNWFKATDQERDRGEPSLIAGITREIMSDFEVQDARVYIAGLSAGGAAAAIMGASYPDLFAAVGVHSGLACGAATDMPSAFAAMRTGARNLQRRTTIRTIVFHGDRDLTVSSVNADQVISQSKSTNSRTVVSQGRAPGGAPYTRTVYTDEIGCATMEQWLVHGLAHAWSGGSPEGSYTDPRGPDASGEMVRFFLQTSKTTERTGIDKWTNRNQFHK
jgi:poly(hydroxyalkanoate) depolymerase family esterase